MNTTHLGDCLTFVKSIADESVDLILTDPPFGYGYLGNARKIKFDKFQNDDIAIVYEILPDLWRVLKPTGAIFIFHSWKRPILHPLVKDVLIWVKDKFGAPPYGNTDHFSQGYECIAFMPKPGWVRRGQRVTNVFRHNIVHQKAMSHPTERPVGLYMRLIELASDPGQTVFDPFAGSGSVLVAAKQTHRKYIGCEIEPKYFDVINKRLSQQVLDLQVT